MRQLFAATPVVAAMQVLGVALVWSLVSWPAPVSGATPWATLMLALVGGRVLVVIAFWRFDQAGLGSTSWLRGYAVLMALTGVGWGAVAHLFFDRLGVHEQLGLGLILMAFAAGGGASLSPVYRIYLLFIVPMMGLWTAYFALRGELPDVMVAILSVSYTLVLLFTTRQQSRILTTSLTLNHENQALIRELKDEIDTRITMAEALRQARDDEEMARVEAEEANRTKSEFLSAMSHELRTPLNAILGFGQLLGLEKEQLTEEQGEQVDHILSSGAHLLELIDQLLDLARIEAGGLEMSFEELDALGLVNASIDLAKPLADQKGVRLELVSDIPEFTNVYCDRLRFNQVMINILSNSIKYNKERGAVFVRISRECEGMVRLEISDTGAGIAENQKQNLFVPFNRLGLEDSEIQGTGIGLSITKDLVESMGGSIDFESEEGVGSTFRFTVPCAGVQAHSSVSG